MLLLLTAFHTLYIFLLILTDFRNIPVPVAIFQDFPVLENAIIKFQDFQGFPGPVWTLENVTSVFFWLQNSSPSDSVENCVHKLSKNEEVNIKPQTFLPCSKPAPLEEPNIAGYPQHL